MRKSKSVKNALVFGVIIVITASVLTSGCSNAKENSKSGKEIIQIKENVFVAQVNDVYLNAEDYMEKPIQLEGIFKKEQSTERDEPYCFVIRYGPGCCGFDGNVGFEVAWAKEGARPYPDAESWVEATGVLKHYDEDSFRYLYLELSSLKKLNRRGAETVKQ